MNRPLIIATGVLAIGIGRIMPMMAISPLVAQSASAQVGSVETKMFAIENMTCALCPVTVKKAMQGVNGVRLVEIDFGAKTARVVFDPTVTSAEAIAKASTNAGYPAHPAG